MSLWGQGLLPRTDPYIQPIRPSSSISGIHLRLQATLRPEVFLAMGSDTAAELGLNIEDARFLLKAAQLEGRAALDAVAADISHQLSHPLGFLRCLTLTDSAELTAEDRELAAVEAERIHLLMRQLLGLRMAAPACEPAPVRQLLKQAAAVLSPPMSARNIAVVLDVQEQAVLHAEPALIYIMLRDMLAEIVARAASSSTVTACLIPAVGAEDTTLTITTSAHGASALPLDDPFNPWNSHAGAPGLLGLALAYRIARTFGWTLSVSGTASAPGLLLTIPASSLALELC